MSVYNTNQARQIYVALGYSASVPTTKGYVNAAKDKEGNLYLTQLGHGGLVRSDLIVPTSVKYAKAAAPADMEYKLKQVAVALDANVASGKLIAGEDYILRINMIGAFGMSDADIYVKEAAVHATSAMVTTPAVFWAEMAYSLFTNFRREPQQVFDILINGKAIATAKKIGSTVTLKDATGAAITTTGATGITIVEKPLTEQWNIEYDVRHIAFTVTFDTVKDGTSDVVWGTATETLGGSGYTVGNGYTIANMEWFYMGERGNIYRDEGHGKTLPTKYFADETKTYYTLDVHYAYQGDCEDIQKSEKDIFIVAESLATITSIITAWGITVHDTAAFKTANTADTTDDGIVD